MTTIKGLTLHQPWASLVAAGAKRIETRSWKTSYRGLIAIHSSLKFPDPAIWREDAVFVRAINKTMDDQPLHLEGGVILAVAELSDCCSMGANPTGTCRAPQYPDWVHGLSHEEQVFGDYSPERYGWMLNRVVALPTPIPYRGSRRLWAIEPDIAQQLMTAWEGWATK